MKRIVSKPLCGTFAVIFYFGVLMGIPSPLNAAETAPVPQYGAEICFPVVTATNLLKDVETLPKCMDALSATEESLLLCEKGSGIKDERIAEQALEIATARSIIDNTNEVCKKAVAAASGSFWERFKANSKWVLAVIVAGLAGYAAGSASK